MEDQREKKARLLAAYEGIAVERSLAGLPMITDPQGQTRGVETTLALLDELPDDWDVELL